jgi:ribosomal protein L6P/L9E
MLQIYKELDLEIPSEVEVKVDSRVITVKGPRGELSKVSPVQRKGEEQRAAWNAGSRGRLACLGRAFISSKGEIMIKSAC